MEKERIIKLSELPQGTNCIVKNVNGDAAIRLRLMDLGFVENEPVMVIKNAPLMDPVEYQVMDSHISLRRNEAEKIDVLVTDETPESPLNVINKKIDFESFELRTCPDTEKCGNEKNAGKKTINVALVGNPNSGKTSLFNHATGLREKVGNYSGVTVDAKVGTFNHGEYTLNLVDLPGTYSITEYTPEELYVREYITRQNPDIVLNIVDASNLERNLYLTTQLIDMNVRMVMALNMFDEFEASGNKLDYQTLGRLFGVPMVPTV